MLRTFSLLSLALTLLAAGLLAAPAAAGELSPGMQTYLAAKAADEPVAALLILEDRVDIQALDWQLHEAGAPFAARHRTVVTRLREHARTTQASLLADLEVRRQLGEVSGYEPYWIVNAVHVVTDDVTVITDLAARRDIEVVEPPLTVELIEPVARRAVADGERGIGITPGVVNVGARRVWSELGITGEGALVANLDTGVDGDHVALRDRWRGNSAPASAAWLDLDGNVADFPHDNGIHGTHTMGTICGVAPGDTIGVAPGAEWIAANTIVPAGSLGSAVLTTLQWLADPDGDPTTSDDVPDVANNSWGVNENFGYPDCYSAWWDAIDACEAAGVVHVWSAGNEGPGSQTLRSPADRATTPYDSFSVGSTSTSPPFNIAYSSSRGPAGPSCGPEEFRIKPEVSAPGVNVYSSIPGNGYTYLSGTSMAGPHVAGTVALMRAANPDLDAITIKQILMDTTEDLGGAGEDNVYGHGIIDAHAAVQAAMSGYGAVAGQVVDDATGAAVAGAEVQLEGGNVTVTTDQTGAFRLNSPAGEATVTVSFFGYADFAGTYEVPAGGEITPELRLEPLPSAQISGRVHAPGTAFPDAAPVAGAVVEVVGTPLPVTETASDGAWSFALPQGESYTIRASLPGQGLVEQTLPATADRTCDLYLRDVPADNFESGALDAFAWTFAGDADWEVTQDQAQEGQFSARSGELGGNATSILRLDVEVATPGELSFWIKTQGTGTLAFWQGFATIASWDDAAQWTRFTHPVEAGEHTFRWRYSTTSSGGSSDRGFLDLVTLPGGEAPAPRLVPCPAAVSAEVASGGQTTATLLLLNQGVEELSGAAAAAEPWLDVAADPLAIAPAGHLALEVTIDAATLPDGQHTGAVVLASDDPDNPTLTVPVTVTVGTTTAVQTTPQAVALLGAMPNPFNPQTTIRFSLPDAQAVRLDIYDVQGRLVRSLLDGVRPAGINRVGWDGRDDTGRGVASGTYFARLRAGGHQDVRSLTLVR
jgi:subtilisin family serine protease